MGQIPSGPSSTSNEEASIPIINIYIHHPLREKARFCTKSKGIFSSKGSPDVARLNLLETLLLIGIYVFVFQDCLKFYVDLTIVN